MAPSPCLGAPWNVPIINGQLSYNNTVIYLVPFAKVSKCFGTFWCLSRNTTRTNLFLFHDKWVLRFFYVYYPTQGLPSFTSHPQDQDHVYVTALPCPLQTNHTTPTYSLSDLPSRPTLLINFSNHVTGCAVSFRSGTSFSPTRMKFNTWLHAEGDTVYRGHSLLIISYLDVFVLLSLVLLPGNWTCLP